MTSPWHRDGCASAARAVPANIIYLLGRDDFARVKLGVGEKPHPDYDLADWVLGRFTKEQGEALEQACSHCDDIVRLFVAGRLDEAMNRYNS